MFACSSAVYDRGSVPDGRRAETRLRMDELDLKADRHRVRHHRATGVEQPAERHAEVLAVDRRRRGEPGPGRAAVSDPAAARCVYGGGAGKAAERVSSSRFGGPEATLDTSIETVTVAASGASAGTFTSPLTAANR